MGKSKFTHQAICQIKELKAEGLGYVRIAKIFDCSASTIRWYTDQDKRRETNKRYLAKNKEKYNKRCRDYYYKHQDELKKKAHDYFLAHRAHYNKMAKEWYYKNKNISK